MERSVSLRDELVAGFAAGVIGGVLWYAYQLAVMVRGGVQLLFGLQESLKQIASTVIGTSASLDPALGVALGLILHFCVAIGWALGYVYLVRTQPYLLSRPWISGIGFGLVVYVFMQIVLLTAGQYHRPASPYELENALIAHVVFYGIPVALVVSRLLRRPATRPGTA